MKKRMISLLVAMVLLISTAVPVTSAFAETAPKYHPDDWFGYHHSEEEISSWITDAVGYPIVSDDAMKTLKGEIRPGDVLSFQVEVDMPTGHDEIMPFLRDFSLNMTLPYGTNAMIEVYSTEAPLMTDEECAERIADFNNSIDELEKELQDEEMLKEIETDAEAKSVYRTYKDLVDNREKYYEVLLGQLETARTKYGSVVDKSEYGSAESWYGSCEDNPNTSLNEDETYESWKENFLESSYVNSQITDEEFEEIVAEFNEQYPSLIEEYIATLEESKNDEETTESDLELINIAIDSINDGTFYNTIIKYFEDCRDGYYQFENDYAGRLISMFLSGWDLHNAYFGTYAFKFPNNIVQRNEHCTYIFDVSIVATNALSVGSYVSIPTLRWFYEENCSTQYWVSEGFLKGHFESYYPCNARRGSLLNLGNATYANNSDFDVQDIEYKVSRDKRYSAWDFIITNYNDENYVNKFKYEYLSDVFSKNVLNAIRPFTIEYRDEFGNLIKSETKETNDAYFNILPEEIYDYQLVGPEYIKGVIQNEDTTIVFNYEHKDAEITVSFVDINGNELAPSEVISGKTLDEYTAELAEVYGYEPIGTPENASGILHEDSENVQFVYDVKDTSVSVNYLDTDGNEIGSDVINGKVFDEYSTEPKEFYGYELVNSSDNTSGVMTEEVTQVDYIYKLKDTSVIVNYLDDEGNKLSSDVISGKVFDDYSAKEKNIYGYRLISTPTNNNGKMTEESITVNYIYTKKPASVIVNYLDENGNALADSEVSTGDMFTKYTSKAKDFYGYVLISSPENASGTMAEVDTVVNYIYQKVFDLPPTDPYDAVYGDKLSDIELPFGWKFEDIQTNPDATVGDVGTNKFTIINDLNMKETVVIKVSPSDWIEGTDYGKLPNEPYKAIVGDTLSDIELPFGWVFDDVQLNPNATVGDAGTNTFTVTVPADKNHSEIKGTVIIEVSPLDWVEGTDYGKLPTEPYKATVGDKLSDIELPFGWVFDDVQFNPDATVGNIGTNTFTVTVPADKTHSEIKGTVTIEVSAPVTVEKPTEQNPADNIPDEEIPSKPIEEQPTKPTEETPSKSDEDNSADTRVEEPTTEKQQSNTSKPKRDDETVTDNDKNQNNGFTAPDTGSRGSAASTFVSLASLGLAFLLLFYKKKKKNDKEKGDCKC